MNHLHRHLGVVGINENVGRCGDVGEVITTVAVNGGFVDRCGEVDGIGAFTGVDRWAQALFQFDLVVPSLPLTAPSFGRSARSCCHRRHRRNRTSFVSPVTSISSSPLLPLTRDLEPIDPVILMSLLLSSPLTVVVETVPPIGTVSSPMPALIVEPEVPSSMVTSSSPWFRPGSSRWTCRWTQGCHHLRCRGSLSWRFRRQLRSCHRRYHRRVWWKWSLTRN